MILAAFGIILAAQNKPETMTPGISSAWIRLNDNVAIELKPCPNPKKGGDPYAGLRGDLCGNLMLRMASDNNWHRVLLDSQPPPIGGIQPVMK